MIRLIIALFLAASAWASNQYELAGEYIFTSNKYVYLSDMFPSSPNGNAVVAKSPKAGNKKVLQPDEVKQIAVKHGIELDEAQLTAVTIERKSVAMSDIAVAAAVRPEVAKHLGHEDFHLQLDLSKHVVKLPADTNIDYVVQSVKLVSGSVFKAELRIVPQGEVPIQATVGGKIVNTVEVPTVNSFIRPGQVIEEVDIAWKKVPSHSVSANSAMVIEDLLGKTAKFGGIQPNCIISLSKLTEPKLIKRGSLVMVHYNSPQLSLTVRAKAKTDGRKGQLIQLERQKSKTMLEAFVTGPGQAMIMPVGG